MNILNRARWMSERGHKVFLCCVRDSPIHQNAEGLELVLVRRNKKHFDYKNAKRLKNSLASKNVGVVWFMDKRDLSVLALTKFLMRSRIKLLYQQCMQIGVNKKEYWHTIRFKQIDFWITPLSYLREQVGDRTKYPVENVHVVPQGLDVELFLSDIEDKPLARKRFKLQPEDLVIGMIGRIDFAKSQRFVMDVVVQLQKDYPQLKLLFVGNKTAGEWEGYYNEIISDIASNHSDGSVQLYPFMKEVAKFYSAIDIFVMASKNETYGMVTIESMICGNIVVGTNAAGTKELLNNEEHGYFFNWQDGESLKAAILKVLHAPKDAARKAQTAQHFARHTFSHHTELKRIEAILASINSEE